MVIRRGNKGFTLVELIVVIVILAILVGVTIGGIYMYVGKAKRNKDIQTAKMIEDTLMVNFAEYCDEGANDWVSFYKLLTG